MMNSFCVRQHVGEDDGLVYEMFFINELKPTLNVQSDSIRAKFLISFLLLIYKLSNSERVQWDKTTECNIAKV